MRDFLSSVVLRLVQVCPAIVPQFFTNWAHHAQHATQAHAFLLSFFVSVENKRLVNPTPKRKVARWNRARHHFLRLTYYDWTGKRKGVFQECTHSCGCKACHAKNSR